MREFQDSTGAKYRIDLPFGEVMRVKRESDGRFNLLEPVDNDLAKRLDSDLPEFWEMLAYLVGPQVEASGISLEEFGRRMPAELLVAAQHLFFSEWHDFFLRLQRPDKALVAEKIAKYRAKAVEMMLLKLKDPQIQEVDQRVLQHLESTLSKPFGNWQARLDAILTPTPGDSSGT